MKVLVQNPYIRAGGAENRIRTLLQALVRRPDIEEVHFMFVGAEPHHQVEAEGKFHYWQIRNNRTRSVTESVIDKFDIDVVQLHNNQLIGVDGIKYAQEVGIPTMWVMHDFWTMCWNRFFCPVWHAEDHDLCYKVETAKCIDCVGQYPYERTKKEREVVQECDIGIVPSKRIRDIFYDAGFMNGKMRIVDPWIDLSLFQPQPVQQKPFQVLFASGNYIPHKGIKVLLRAWNHVQRRLPNANLVSIGDQRCLAETIALSKKLKLQNVNMIGHMPQEQLRNLYTESTVTVFPSIWEETIGLTWIESLACGTPVICSKTGSIPELLKYGGELFEPRDHLELAERIMDMLMNVSKRVKLAKEGVKYVNSAFQPERAAKDFTNIYYELGDKL